MADEPSAMRDAMKEAQKASQNGEKVGEPVDAGLQDTVPKEDSSGESPALSPEVIEDTFKYEKKIDEHGRSYATGKRKDAIARVWIKPGSGKIQVNNREFENYFARPVLRMIIHQPFEETQRKGHYDVRCTVSGGGLSGQAGALRLGISKALTLYEPDLRSALKKGGFLTRDSRVVERKKYGRRKARRSFQFSKR